MEGVVSAVNGQPVQKVPGEGNLPGDIPPNWDELYAEEQSAEAGLPEDPPETEPVPEDPGDVPVTDPGGDPDGGEPAGLDMDTAIAEQREDKPDTGGAQAVSQPPPPMMSQPAPSMDLPPPPPERPDGSGRDTTTIHSATATTGTRGSADDGRDARHEWAGWYV